MVALERPDVEMAVEVSFSVGYLIERLLTFVIWAESQPLYRCLFYRLMILLKYAYVIGAEILVHVLSHQLNTGEEIFGTKLLRKRFQV